MSLQDRTAIWMADNLAVLVGENEQLRAENEQLKTFIKNIHDNYDCDSDSHKYQNGFGCRCCDAKKLLEGE